MSEIKNMQRSNQTAKLSWWEYCDTHYAGVRDPNRHDAEVLQDFISAFNSGSLPTPSEQPQSGGKGGQGGWTTGLQQGGIGGGAADLIKLGQRQSQGWKVAWQTYCTAYGTGKFDPNSYDQCFITGFLDYVGGLAVSDMGGVPQQQQYGGGFQAPQYGGQGLKRPGQGMFMPPGKRAGFNAPGNFGQGASADVDPEKAGLVQQVKSFQRSSTEAKDLWGSYCDNNLGGVRDPNRHTADILKAFIAECGGALA